MNSSVNILGFNVVNTSLNKFIDTIISKVYSKEKFIVGYLNVFVVNYARSNSKFFNLIKGFSATYPDGVGIYIATKFLFGKRGLIESTTGTDLYYELIKAYPRKKYFLLGGVENCSNKIKENSSFIKNINIVGSIYRPTDSIVDFEIINKSGADILMVALGTPYQEEWIIQNKDKVNVPVIIAVGSGLDFLAGVKKRAPLWMQKIGLEWLYRLFQEPKRLWKRYIIGIPVFMFNIILIKVKLMLKKEST